MEDALPLVHAGTASDAAVFEQGVDVAGDRTDEELARIAREQYREHGIAAIEPDEAVASQLKQGEQLLAIKLGATVGRVDAAIQAPVYSEGQLYVTSRRLLHLGSPQTAIDLGDIEELAMADDRILLTITGSRGVMIDASEPRQLRVLLAAAKSALNS